MEVATNRACELLERKGISFQLLRHPEDHSAPFTAAHTHTPGASFAKVVVVLADGIAAMAVIPAHHRLRLDALEDALGADVRLATEPEMARLFPDGEIGAEPPLGALYGVPVFLSRDLEGPVITFNAGSHVEAIRMRFEDYLRVAQPRVLDISEPGSHGSASAA